MALRIARWGNSLAVRLPKTLIDESGLKEGDEVDAAVADDGTLTLQPRARRETLDDLVSRITPENRHEATDWGPTVGKEAW